MNYFKFLIYLLCLVVALRADVSSTSTTNKPPKKSNADDSETMPPCPKTLSPGPRTVCAGHQYERNKITQSDFITILNEVIHTFPPEEKYYSVGFMSSHTPGIAVGVISDPVFDKKLQVPVDPRLARSRQQIITSKTYKKPVLLYTYDDIMRESANPIETYHYTAVGSGMRKNLFRVHNGVVSVTEDSQPDCTAYSKWTDVEHLRHKTGLVVLADAGTFCPQFAAAHFDVIMGNYKLSDGIYTPVWEKSHNHEYGKVPEWVSAFF